MTEEEKEAIKWFKEDLQEEKETLSKKNNHTKLKVKRNEILLNLIQKQEAEIERNNKEEKNNV